MATSVEEGPSDGPRPCGEIARPVPAKASLPNRDEDDRAAFGAVLRRVQHLLGKNRDEMADALGVDARQLSRWYQGIENAQVWRYHRQPKLRDALRLADAHDDESVVVRTVIEMTRKVGD